MIFTYLIGWSKLNKYYYGVRWAKDSCPTTLWSKYKTSSKYVKNFFKENGEPDIIQIRKTFSSIESARKHENRVLLYLHKNDPFGSNSKWLNKTTNISIINHTPYIRTDDIKKRLRDINKGKSPSLETRNKISNANKGKKHSKETKEKISIAHKGKIISRESIEKANKTKRERYKPYNISKEHKEKIGKALSNYRKGKTYDQLYSNPEEILKKRQLQKSKNWIIIYPDKTEKIITNLSQFCLDNNLNRSCMADIPKGRQKIHRGYSIRAT